MVEWYTRGNRAGGLSSLVKKYTLRAVPDIVGSLSRFESWPGKKDMPVRTQGSKCKNGVGNMKKILILGLIIGVLAACFSEPTLAGSKVKRMEESMDAGTLSLRLDHSTVEDVMWFNTERGRSCLLF